MPIPSLGEIISSFADADNYERVEYLLELGTMLPPFPESQRIYANRVFACQSNTWIFAKASKTCQRLTFFADSEAPTVKGLAAILLAAYDDKKPAEVLEFPYQQLFVDLNIKLFVSPLRKAGMGSMVQVIRKVAQDRV